MDQSAPFEIFLVAPPGVEPWLCDEARAAGFAEATAVAGGVTVRGGWPEVWRANLVLRGAVRVLARIGSFRALHLAQLDKRARRFPWAGVLRPDVPVRVEVTCRASRIYHAGAAAQRIETALREELGVPILPRGQAAGDEDEGSGDAVALKVRIEDDLVTLSLDSSGEPLHRRGHKQQVNKAPMRETLAAMILRGAGFDGTGPVYDPMCGSGTFPIEAAEIAAGLLPGRSRGFAFERLASFDAGTWAALKAGQAVPRDPGLRFYGSDRDTGAVAMSRANAERAGVAVFTRFERATVAEMQPPCEPPGLLVVNPPYGARIGDRRLLFGLYGAFGQSALQRFRGWRVALVTSDTGLARATDLPFLPPGPAIAHGGLRIQLWQTGPLA
ncbi:THUMP domain-containing class I SAM-dependent RNA methyltransferase [Frigidibacter oleivorans]|uniref:THUMP domain-containing class I SAM-dependent RNA methyltransferase n=1 Tax=Frigidibacter oleivorans TaxID=2487129 RepID=UPI000F8E8D7F|nr:class I SAM-dependent RNA methyltransferase [Frigidibacter oleivorans]